MPMRPFFLIALVYSVISFLLSILSVFLFIVSFLLFFIESKKVGCGRSAVREGPQIFAHTRVGEEAAIIGELRDLPL